jgi:hypothetical protein
MAAGLPAKTSWAANDVFTSAGANDLAGTVNLLGLSTITATAAGTTVLTVASNRKQTFTGTTTQTVTLPAVSTLSLGDTFEINNSSTGVVTVQSSGANSVLAMATMTRAVFVCILVSGTTAASWSAATSISPSLIDAAGDLIVGTADNTVGRLGIGTALQVLRTNAGATGLEWAAAAAGKVVQVVNVQTGTLATGTTIIPLDDTIPQNTEGDQYMSLAITPTNVNNILIIQVVFNSATSSSVLCGVALFQDAVANALASTAKEHTVVDQVLPCAFTHRMVAGTTSATTFKVRSGGNGAATSSFNGRTGVRLYGGVQASSITIWEVLP